LIGGKPDIRKGYLKELAKNVAEIRKELWQRDTLNYLDTKKAPKIPFAQKVQDLMRKVISLEYYLRENTIDHKELIQRVQEVQALLDPTYKWMKKRGDSGGGGSAGTGAGMMSNNLNPSVLSEDEYEAIKTSQEHRLRKIKVNEDKKTIKITTTDVGVITFKSSECPRRLLNTMSEIYGIKLQALYMEDTKTIFQKDAELIELNCDENGNINQTIHKIYDNLPVEFTPIVDYIKSEEKKKKKENYEMEM
jgi:hypothetical protein